MKVTSWLAVPLVLSLCGASVPLRVGAQNGSDDGKHHIIFPHHPHLRRITKAIGIGVVTGGIGGAVLGAGAVHGAMLGAAEHGGYRAWKERRAIKKQKKQEKEQPAQGLDER